MIKIDLFRSVIVYDKNSYHDTMAAIYDFALLLFIMVVGVKVSKALKSINSNSTHDK